MGRIFFLYFQVARICAIKVGPSLFYKIWAKLKATKLNYSKLNIAPFAQLAPARLGFTEHSSICRLSQVNFFLSWPSIGEHLFDHLPWSIFQSSKHKHYKLHFFIIPSVGSFSCTASTPVFLTCGFSFMVVVLMCLIILSTLNSKTPQYIKT